jgi:hypothetical protein
MDNLPGDFKLVTFSEEKLNYIWDKIKDFDTIFVDDRMSKKEVYLKQFAKHDTIVLENDGGIIIITKIDPGLKATFHPVFWDHKLSARYEDLRDVLVWVFLYFKLERVETQIAPYAKAAIRFIEKKMGFTYEGTLRSYVRRHGNPMDMKVYSILREEVL